MTVRSGDDRPTVLLLGRGDPMHDALALALERNGVAVERAETDHAVDAVFVGAPDLVLLLGDAADDEGSAVLAKLANNVATAVVPVAVLSDDADLDHRLRAFRFGAVAVVERSASADAMARRVAELAHELPERSGETAGELGEASLDEVVELFSHRLRSGILAVTAASGGGQGARIVLRGDRPVTQAIEEFVDRIRPLVSKAEPLVWEFQETPTGKLRQLDLDEPSGEVDVTKLLAGRRIVLVERSPARADELVQALRQRGAHVVVIDGEGVGIAKARAIDPDVIVVDVEGVAGWASTAMRSIRRDPRLRWASLLVVRAQELWPESAPEPDVAKLATGLMPLIEPDEATERRARDASGHFDLRMETTGPARMLRALAKTGRTLHVALRHRRASVAIDLAEGLVVGASAKLDDGEELAGTAALAALLALGSGRVRVEPREAPSVANVMAPIDDALAAADRESPPLRPSLPPSLPPPGPAGARAPSATPAGGIARSSDPRELVVQLESLLGKLRATLPPSAAKEIDAVVPPRDAAASLPRKPPRKQTMVGIAPPVAAAPPPPIAPRPARLPAITEGMIGEEPTRELAPGEVGALKEAARTDLPAPPDPPAGEPLPSPGRAPRNALPAPRMGTAQRAVVPAPGGESASPGATIAGAAAAAPEPASVVLAPEIAPAEVRAEALSHDDVAGLFSIPEMEIEPPRAASAAPPAQTPSAPALAATPPPASVAMPPPEETTPIALPPSRRGWILVPIALLVGALIVGGTAWAWWSGMLGGAPVAQPTPMVPPPLGVIPEPVATTAPPPATDPAAAGVAATDPAPAVPPDTVADPAVALPTDGDDPATADDTTADDDSETVEDTAAADTAADDTATDGAMDDEAEEDDEGRDGASGEDSTSEGRPLVAHLVARANFRRTHGELQAAETDYLRVLRLEPRNARAIAGLTRLHMARRDPRAAAQWARRLVAVRPTQPGNHVLLGDVLLMAGDRAGARRSWERALQLSPGHRDARRRLASGG